MSAESVDGVAIGADDGVLRIRLDRPARKNALDVAAIGRVVGALEAAAVDDTLRVVVVSGAGDDFCAGADWVATNTSDGPRPRTGSIQRRTPLQAHRLIALLVELQLPVVCRVQGWAAGLGCQLALAADFTVAADTSRFWEPFLRRGFSPDSGATWLLPRLVGVARAKELLLLGRELSGADAAELGTDPPRGARRASSTRPSTRSSPSSPPRPRSRSGSRSGASTGRSRATSPPRWRRRRTRSSCRRAPATSRRGWRRSASRGRPTSRAASRASENGTGQGSKVSFSMTDSVPEQLDGETGADWHRRVVGRSLRKAADRSVDRGMNLIRAAATVLDRSGGEDITVQEVADEAGQSLRTLYQYFESKDDLLLAVFEEAMRTYARAHRPGDLGARPTRSSGSRAGCSPSSRMPAFSDGARARGLSRLRLRLSETQPDLIARAQSAVTALLHGLVDDAVTAGRSPPPIPSRRRSCSCR